jgi:hypothetical protein
MLSDLRQHGRVPVTDCRQASHCKERAMNGELILPK